MKLKNLKQALGPGLLYAGAAIGVSHFVASTKAGATSGFALLAILIIAVVSKYPFIQIGTRYTIATNESLIDGYKRLGWWAQGLFILLNLLSMFTIQAVVTLVCSGVLGTLVKTMSSGAITIPIFYWCVIITLLCITFLIVGHYSLLDKMMKIVVTLMSVCTIATVLIVLMRGDLPPDLLASFNPANAPKLYTIAGLTSIFVFIAWMPTPLDCAAWQSQWTLSREKQTQYKPTIQEAELDFKIGYFGSALLGVFFLALGALMIYGTQQALAPTAIGFSNQVVTMYTQAIGGWSYGLIAFAAFTCMFSTMLTVTDAYPRISRRLAEINLPNMGAKRHDLLYFISIVFVNCIALGIIYYATMGGGRSQFARLVNIATILTILTAPVFAAINLSVMQSKHTPEAARFKGAYLIFVYLCLAMLVLIAAAYLYFLIDPSLFGMLP